MPINPKNRNRIRRTIRTTSVTVLCIDKECNDTAKLVQVLLPTWYRDEARLIQAVKHRLAEDGIDFIRLHNQPTRGYAVYEMTHQEFLEHAHLVKDYDESQVTI